MFDKLKMFCLSGALLLLFAACAVSVAAQATAFTYQGKLNDTNSPANASYDMQFRLFDNPNAGQGTQAGATFANPSVTATNGIFTVQLDFGSTVFAAGADLYLEISLRLAGSSGGYTSLAPRQRLTSAPYAIRALKAASADTATNATQLGGTAANQFVQTGDARLSDARPPTGGSANYIQNTTSQQSSSNFNIAGNGTAAGTLSGNAVNATTQYNIGGSRVLSIPGFNNLFAGLNAGNANTTGSENTFVGRDAGRQNTTGSSNSFIGENAGLSNTTGNSNSFVGTLAGFANTTGSENSFFGESAGQANNLGCCNAFFGRNAGKSTTAADGNSNSFFGYYAGFNNTTGCCNSFVGADAGNANTTGGENTFVGVYAGYYNTTGRYNTFLGYNADVNSGNTNLSYATAIGAEAVVSSSNTVVLGRSADTVRIPGNLVVTGSVSKGSGSFRIDHPLDPANKYLYHSFVESPDMMNVYNGNVVTNAKGEAIIKMPDYFEALNRDFRYQLTVIGQFAQVIVAEKIKGNQFKIKTDKPRIEVSWQVTGIRHDKFADDERIKIEETKPADERGQCLYAPACQ